MSIANLMAQEKQINSEGEDLFLLLEEMESLFEDADDKISREILKDMQKKLSTAFSNEKLREELREISSGAIRASS